MYSMKLSLSQFHVNKNELLYTARGTSDFLNFSREEKGREEKGDAAQKGNNELRPNSVRHGSCNDVFCIRKNGISPQGCGSDCKF